MMIFQISVHFLFCLRLRRRRHAWPAPPRSLSEERGSRRRRQTAKIIVAIIIIKGNSDDMTALAPRLPSSGYRSDGMLML